MLVLNHCIQMIKARIATCEFILPCVNEFKYIRDGIILRSIILYLKDSGSSRPRVKSARVKSAGSTRPGQVGLIYMTWACIG